VTGVIRIGTRGSALALWQADHVAGLLRAAHPGVQVERVVIKTMGDRILDVPLSDIGDKGLFTKELERALLLDEADLAVHSMKDVPTAPVPGLVLAAVPARGAVEDAWVSARWPRFDDVPAGATIATGSLRREAQLRHLRPDVGVVDIRGNVQTRLAKLDEHQWDGMLLARAGLERLGLHERIAQALPLERFIPAVGQGALYVQAREGSPAAALAAALDVPAVSAAVRAERRFMAELEGGCQVPMGAHARLVGERLHIVGFVARRDGSQLVRRAAEGVVGDPEAAGLALADAIRAAGGAAILEAERAVVGAGAAFTAPARER
jgi:hydroxymethylbilane synthase